MADYDFYVGSYLGTLIPEGSFPKMIARAQAELDSIRRYCQVTGTGETSENMALCAMAEVLYEAARRQGVRSTSVGGVSVTYDDGRLDKALYRAAEVYLEIGRGVG